MHIMIISRGFPHGESLNGIFEFDQAKALSAIGHQISFIALDYRSISYKRNFGVSHFKRDNIDVFEVSLPFGMYRRMLPLLKCFLLFVYKKAVRCVGKPDIIHAHFYFIAAIASVLKRYNIPMVITEHSSKQSMALTSISKIDKRLSLSAYNKADRVIAVSKPLATYLQNNYGIKSTVIHNIVDSESFHYMERDGGTFSFISIGSLEKRKGYDILIDAFNRALLPQDVKLKIIGEGLEREGLQNQIDGLGLSSRISLLGLKSRSDICAIMKESKAFVLASRRETFGVVFIEAMLTGLPVIATRCGGPEDFINEQNGMVVPVGDVEALTKALEKMYETIDVFDTKEISDSCREHFSPTTIAYQIENLYRDVLSNHLS